jgi:putative solute:sodium symporter small subunit
MDQPQPAPAPRERNERLEAYWKENQRLIYILAAIWFIFSFVHPLFVRQLNNVSILTGFPLGYWLASQGSLVVFVILIFVYALMMNNVIDPKYGFGEREEEE